MESAMDTRSDSLTVPVGGGPQQEKRVVASDAGAVPEASLRKDNKSSDDGIDFLPKKGKHSRFSIFWSEESVSESIKFALRVSLALTLASLFTLCFGPGSIVEYPDPIWVYITAGIVSWQPTPDTGSVLQKAWQRSLGTFVGGLLGLAIGAISLAIPDHGSAGQAAFIGICNSIFTFLIIYFTCELGFRKQYPSILGTFTFGMILLAFFDEEPQTSWRVAVFRIVNIVVGGFIGSITSLIVYPVSTKHFIDFKVSDAMKQAGISSQEVLCSFRMEKDLPSYESIARDEEMEDPGHAAYKKGISDVHAIKAAFPLLSYDPFFARLEKMERKKELERWKIKIGRIARIQMNIICIDNLVRSKLLGDDSLDHDLLLQIGKHAAVLLDDTEVPQIRKQTAFAMLNEDLPEVHKELAQRRLEALSAISEATPVVAEEMMRRLSTFDDNPVSDLLFVKETVLFYQMVELLILRCIRLYHL